MKKQLRNFLLSLPERGLRSASAVAGGLLRELGDVAIPKTMRSGQLYRNLVDGTLRFLIEEVGQVKNTYPGGEKLSRDFLLRRAAGNGIDLIGILTFRASPVWVLAALADASGAGRFLVREITDSLKAEGLLEQGVQFETVDEMLVGLEAAAGRFAATVNAPPLDVKSLREEWKALRADFAKIPPRRLPGTQALGELWKEIEYEAARQNRSVFHVCSLMAISAMKSVPEKARWLSVSAGVAASRTGATLGSILLEDYRTSLNQIRKTGYVRYAVDQFRPYLSAAVSQFSPRRQSLTERLISADARRKKRGGERRGKGAAKNARKKSELRAIRKIKPVDARKP